MGPSSCFRPHQHLTAAGVKGHHLAGIVVEDLFGIQGAGDLFDGGAGVEAFEPIVKNTYPVLGVFDVFRIPSFIFL